MTYASSLEPLRCRLPRMLVAGIIIFSTYLPFLRRQESGVSADANFPGNRNQLDSA